MGLCSLLVIYLGPHFGGDNDDNGNLLQKVPCPKCYIQCPQPCSRPPLTHASARGSWRLTGRSGLLLWGPCSFLLGPGVHRVLFVPSKSLFPLSCVSSGGSMVGLMAAFSKEGLCNTQVCCTQSPCPCGRPLLTCPSAGNTQTQFCLSLCGVSGSLCTQGRFEPSEHLLQVWGLILKVISPTILLGLLLCPWTWGISSQPLQQHAFTHLAKRYLVFCRVALWPYICLC